jgi:hypothetical protein
MLDTITYGFCDRGYDTTPYGRFAKYRFQSALFMTVRNEVGLSCLSGLSGAELLSDPNNSPFNIHNSQLFEPRLLGPAGQLGNRTCHVTVPSNHGADDGTISHHQKVRRDGWNTGTRQNHSSQVQWVCGRQFDLLSSP